jgi:tetratricopeptide (TPR) repeat protein
MGRLVCRMPQSLVLVVLAILLPLSYSTANASSYWVDDLTLFEHASRLAPENSLARNNYAVALSRNGQQDKAIAMLQKLADEHPGYFLGNYNLGRLLYEMNLIGAAEHYLQRARSLQPDRPESYLQLGLICMKTGRRDQALSNFRRANALQPHDPALHFALGVVLASRGECAQARAEFSEALTLKPDLIKAQEQMDKCGVAAGIENGAVPAAGRATAPASSGPTPAVRPARAPGKGS